MTKISPYALGATLYMPATRTDLLSVVLGEKIPSLRSLVICLEDAVSESDVGYALDNLQRLLITLSSGQPRYKNAPLVFIRPRNLAMATQLVEWPLISLIDGFVLPKFTLHDLPIWQHLIAPTQLWARLKTCLLAKRQSKKRLSHVLRAQWRLAHKRLIQLSFRRCSSRQIRR